PATAQEGDAGFRYRDFSPEGRRAARHPWPPAAEPADLDYRTQNRPDQVPSSAPVPEPAASTPPEYRAPVASPPLGSASPAYPAPANPAPTASAPPVVPTPAGASAPPVT